MSGVSGEPRCHVLAQHRVDVRLPARPAGLGVRGQLAREDDWGGERVPAYVEREFRHDLECGILAYGFARARCPQLFSQVAGMTFSWRSRAKAARYAPRATPALRRETAAHLVDHVIPPLPVRQWVLSVPKRLRWYLEREPRAVSAVLHIFLRVIEAHLRATIPAASPRARLGAVSFVHRFGSALNRHVHFDENRPGSRAARALRAPKSAPGGLVIAASSTACSIPAKTARSAFSRRRH